MRLRGEEAAECEERDAGEDDGARGEDLGEAADDGEEGGGGDEVAGGEPHGEGGGVEVDGEGALDHGEAGHVCCCWDSVSISTRGIMMEMKDGDEMERVQWMKMSTNKLMPIATPRAKPTSWFDPSRAPPPPSAVCRREASSRSSATPTPESVHLPGEASPRSGSWPASRAVCSGGSSAPVSRAVGMIEWNFFLCFVEWLSIV